MFCGDDDEDDVREWKKGRITRNEKKEKERRKKEWEKLKVEEDRACWRVRGWIFDQIFPHFTLSLHLLLHKAVCEDKKKGTRNES